MRLIDADALIDSMPDWDYFLDEYDAERVYGAIDKATTIDAVPVVVCKDCYYWKQFQNNKQHGTCDRGHSQGVFAEDDYCSFAEKKGCKS